MAKNTKYTALKKIINLNGKSYEVGETIKGLNPEQEQRLTDIAAIEPMATETTEAANDTNEGGEKPAE